LTAPFVPTCFLAKPPFSRAFLTPPGEWWNQNGIKNGWCTSAESIARRVERELRVGGATEIEVKERKDRVDDAMHATRAAVEEGVLPGGGVALLRAIKALEKLKVHNDDQRTGIEIVKKALSWPARQIAINAGEDGSIVVGKILDKDTYAFGFDAQTGEYGNLVTKGIIDPTKVVRAALQGAASVAGLLITTEAMVAELPKKQGPAMPGGPGGGMGGMGGMDF
jgi:chaperonin GroEL